MDISNNHDYLVYRRRRNNSWDNILYITSQDNSLVRYKSFQDNTTSDPLTVVKNHWGTDIWITGIYRFSTATYSYLAYVYFNSVDYGSVIIIGYGAADSEGNYLIFASKFNGAWTQTYGSNAEFAKIRSSKIVNFDTTSGAGWYRIIHIKDIAGGAGLSCNFTVTRSYRYLLSEQYNISFYGAFHSYNFAINNGDTASANDYKLLKKIRAVDTSDTEGYIDIYYDSSYNNPINVFIDSSDQYFEVIDQPYIVSDDSYYTFRHVDDLYARFPMTQRKYAMTVSEVDLNNIVSSGIYYSIDCNHAPASYFMFISCNFGGDAFQFGLSLANNKLYYRMLNSNTWHPWMEVSGTQV